jgi:hypothetical protein
MPVQWIDYKGHQVLYADYRGLVSEEKMMENLKTEAEFYQKISTKVLSLNDYRDTYVSNTFINKVTELGKINKDKNLRSAILGITGMKKLLLNTFSTISGMPVRSFDNEIEAKEYLIK